jgi:CRP/FNR family cyclic AMP-dependent transcriptional regulator
MNERSKTRARFDLAVFLGTSGEGRVISAHRKRRIIFAQGDAAVLGPDEFLGEGCLIGQPKRLATATAMTECVTVRVETTEIRRVLQDEPTFSGMFLSHILTRSARIEEDLRRSRMFA